MRDWASLTAELDRWSGTGRQPTFWWRDDDAADAVPGLERLASLTRRWRVPVAFAAIPARIRADTAGLIAACPLACVLQHGYDHLDHSEGGAARIELSDSRNPQQVRRELLRGRRLLERYLEGRTLPVLVPPWNRIGPRLGVCVSGWGFRGLSTFGPRRVVKSPRFVHVNAHVDLIDWDADARFCGETPALRALVGHLRARRRGHADPTEPTGIVSHHRQMCDRAFVFAERLIETLEAHPDARWVDARSAFAGCSGDV
jgi:hypothetical protein